MPAEPAPLRADAHRNRVELLRVGAQALAELGINASTREIARRAGLATGTFFRHFPTKDDLLSAIMADHYDRMAAIATELLAGDLPPREALEAYMERAAEQIAPDRGYLQIVLMAGHIPRRAAALDEAVGQLLARAQAEGSVRADIAASDVQMLVEAASVRPELWSRYIALVLAGLTVGPPGSDPQSGGLGR